MGQHTRDTPLSRSDADCLQYVLYIVVVAPSHGQEFKPVRFFVLMGMAAFVVCGGDGLLSFIIARLTAETA